MRYTVYLAGPINKCTDAEALDWRRAAREALEREGLAVLDPMSRDFRGCEQEHAAEIVAGDLADIRACDIVLANCAHPSWGTAMELRYAAAELGRRVIAFGAGDQPSPWLAVHCTLVANLLTALTYLALQYGHAAGPVAGRERPQSVYCRRQQTRYLIER